MEDHKITELTEVNWQKMSKVLDREMPEKPTKNRVLFIWWSAAAGFIAAMLIVSQNLVNPLGGATEKVKQYTHQSASNSAQKEDLPISDLTPSKEINSSSSNEFSKFEKVEKITNGSQSGTSIASYQSREASLNKRITKIEDIILSNLTTIDALESEAISHPNAHLDLNSIDLKPQSADINGQKQSFQTPTKVTLENSLVSKPVKIANTTFINPLDVSTFEQNSLPVSGLDHSNINTTSDEILPYVTAIDMPTVRNVFAPKVLENRHLEYLTTAKNVIIIPSSPSLMNHDAWNFSLEIGALTHDYASILSIHGGLGVDRYLNDRFKLYTKLRYRSFIQNSDLISNLEGAKESRINDLITSVSPVPRGIFVVNGAGLTYNQIESLDRSILDAFTNRVDYLEGGFGIGYDISRRIVINGGVQVGYKVNKDYHFKDIQIENLKANNLASANVELTPFIDGDYHRQWIVLMQGGTEIKLNSRWSFSLKANYMPGVYGFNNSDPLMNVASQSMTNQKAGDRNIGFETGIKFFLN